MALKPSYILCPNFEHRPSSSPIQIGSLIADPFTPTKTLSLLAQPPETDSIVQTLYKTSRSSRPLLKAKLWANFQTFVDAPITSSKGKHVTHSFAIDTLETRRLRQEPQDDDADLLARLGEPKVRATIRAGIYGNQPVYLVSGLKIARGLAVRREVTTVQGTSLGGSLNVAQNMTFGAEISKGTDTKATDEFKMSAEEEVIFAYRVHKIRLGKKKSTLKVDIYEDAPDLYHGDDAEADSAIDGDVEITNPDFSSLAEGEVDDGGSDEELDLSEANTTEFVGEDGEHYFYADL